MSLGEQTIKCPICGKPYVGYSMMVGDQSACPECRAKARKHLKYGWDTEANDAKAYGWEEG